MRTRAKTKKKKKKEKKKKKKKRKGKKNRLGLTTFSSRREKARALKFREMG